MSEKITNLISRSEYCVPTETLQAGSENRPVTKSGDYTYYNQEGVKYYVHLYYSGGQLKASDLAYRSDYAEASQAAMAAAERSCLFGSDEFDNKFCDELRLSGFDPA